jgi:hypothetical protein
LSQTAGIVAIIFAVLWLGTLVHESGHALIAMAFGAHIEEVNVVGLNIYPALRLHYQQGKFGYVRFDRTLPYPQVEYMRLAGSLSTLVVALLAQGILWSKPPRRRTWPRLIAIAFCCSWIDTFWHTLLALLGLRSTTYAEAYNALVALGASGWLVSMAVVGISALLLILTLVRWRQLVRPIRDAPHPGSR